MVLVWVALDRGSVVVEGRLVGLALKGIPVPLVAGFTSSSYIFTSSLHCVTNVHY